MSAFKKALSVYNNGEPLTDSDLLILLGHFRQLSKLVAINPDLKCMQLYAYMNLDRLDSYYRARNEKNK